MFEDLREFVGELERRGQLVTLTGELDPRYEVAAALRALDQRGLAGRVRVRGYGVPVVGNLLRDPARLGLALGVDPERMEAEYLRRRERPLEPVPVRARPEVEVGERFDLLEHLPVLTHHRRDAGPYITTGVVMARDPDTGTRGMGIHRIQVKGPQRIGLFLATPPLSRFLERSERLGRPLEIAVAIGLDPLTFLAAVIWAPQGVDKLAVAGGLRGRPVEVRPCRTVDLEVPARAEFVLEGRVLPGVREPEGPFGESTGYYFAYQNPVAELTFLSHRRDPLYHALVPWCAEEAVLLETVWKLDNLRELRARIPGLRDLALYFVGLVAVVSLEEGDAWEALEAVAEQMPLGKVLVAVNADVNVRDPREVLWALATRVRLERDLVVRPQVSPHPLDPSGGGATRALIDATVDPAQRKRFERLDFPPEACRRALDLVRQAMEGGLEVSHRR